jgi:AcrR family transcriptional regulator
MTSAADKRVRRAHDAAASRRALLDAASVLFDERGYERTTVREIGERAGVDAALIARYFGGKEGLYLASLAEAPLPAAGGDPQVLAERVLRRTDARGMGPVSLAMVSPTLSDAMRDQVRDVIAARTVGPVAAVLAERDVPDAQLRAELLAATVVGLSLMRAGATLPALRDASLDDVLRILAPALAALCEDPER